MSRVSILRFVCHELVCYEFVFLLFSVNVCYEFVGHEFVYTSMLRVFLFYVCLL